MNEKVFPSNEIYKIQPWDIIFWINEALQTKKLADELEDGDPYKIQKLLKEFYEAFPNDEYSMALCQEIKKWFAVRIEKICGEEQEKRDQAQHLMDEVIVYVSSRISDKLIYLENQVEIQQLEREGYMTLEQLSNFLGVQMQGLQFYLIEAVKKNHELGAEGISGDFKIKYPGSSRAEAMYQSYLAEPFLNLIEFDWDEYALEEAAEPVE